MGSTFALPPEAARRSFLDLPDVGVVGKVIALAIAAAIVAPMIGFFGYLLGVALAFGMAALVAAYAGAFWLVLQLRP